MDYPNLLLAIRASGRPQYVIAQSAGIRAGRLSEIVRRGGANPQERKALSRTLKVPEKRLFTQSNTRNQSGTRATTMMPQPEIDS